HLLNSAATASRSDIGASLVGFAPIFEQFRTKNHAPSPEGHGVTLKPKILVFRHKHTRLEYVKRSAGKSACGKAAYNSRSRIEFEGSL
ncbi:MAG: hypothetical protein K940chlam9_00591, partial [Chlamydiae bacterium]|nr:hypothetical protein [Chlamydiota bacterium]